MATVQKRKRKIGKPRHSVRNARHGVRENDEYANVCSVTFLIDGLAYKSSMRKNIREAPSTRAHAYTEVCANYIQPSAELCFGRVEREVLKTSPP